MLDPVLVVQELFREETPAKDVATTIVPTH